MGDNMYFREISEKFCILNAVKRSASSRKFRESPEGICDRDILWIRFLRGEYLSLPGESEFQTN